MDINMQAKLLRALQEKEIVRVGSNEVVKIDVRIIVATHRNLLEMVKNGTFREDLYYRVLGLPINLPALRERENDVLVIANSIIDGFCKENKLPKKMLTTEAKKKLLGHAFPGNVRELKSVIELACVMSEEKEIDAEHVNVTSQNLMSDFMMKEVTLKEFTTKFIQFYLDKYNYDVLKVARKLDVGKSTIYRMIQNKEVFVHKKYSFEASFMN
jgi:DNA-binding NtrC family response regulator